MLIQCSSYLLLKLLGFVILSMELQVRHHILSLIIPFKDGSNAMESCGFHIPGGKYIPILLIAHKLELDKSELKIPVQEQSNKRTWIRTVCSLNIMYINFHYTIQVCSRLSILYTNYQFSKSLQINRTPPHV
jgi:hypothetical protein